MRKKYFKKKALTQALNQETNQSYKLQSNLSDRFTTRKNLL